MSHWSFLLAASVPVALMPDDTEASIALGFVASKPLTKPGISVGRAAPAVGA
jgi:hypothetical protein